MSQWLHCEYNEGLNDVKPSCRYQMLELDKSFALST